MNDLDIQKTVEDLIETFLNAGKVATFPALRLSLIHI